jgi:hypothetical protein
VDIQGSERRRCAVLYLVIERFKDGDAVPVYRRFGERGRMTPDGLRYVDSWVDTDYARCFQVMESDDPGPSRPGWTIGATRSPSR